MFPTKEELTEILVKNMMGEGKTFDDLQDSWFTKHLIIALREAMWVLLLVVKMVYENLTVVRASGQILDDKGYDFGVDRKCAVKAVHTVTLHKATPVLVDTPIPDGFLLTTTAIGNKPPVKFQVLVGQQKYIKTGEKTVSDVLVECTEFGTVGNVSNGAINLIAQAGFDSVTDSKIYLYGTETEADEPYRQRILERKRRPARAGVPADWERWVLEVEGVTKAKCFRCARGPGTADIIIWGKDGTIPEQGLIEKCQEYLEKNYIPADLHHGGILVVAPELVTINIEIQKAVLKKGYTVEMAKEILQKAFSEYFKSEKTIEMVSVVDCIVCIRTAYDEKDTEKTAIIEDFVLGSPFENIVLNAKQSPVIGNLEVIEHE